MNTKKIIISIVSLTLVIFIVFSACGKATYTDPQTGKKYILVTDENGEKVRSEDGELLVYVTNKNHKIVKDENGVPQTEVHGFIGQIEDEKGIIEDYAYTVTLPEGWKSTDKKGYFENEKLEAKFSISIVEYTYDDYKLRLEDTYGTILGNTESGDETTVSYDVKWTEDVEIPNSDTTGTLLTLSSSGYNLFFYIYENSGNTYKISVDGSTANGVTEETAKELLSSITYKPYTYYPDLVSSAEGD